MGVRHSKGTVTLPEVSKQASVTDLQKLVASATGIEAERQVIKHGVPPVVLSSELGDAVQLADLPLGTRDLLTLEERSPPRTPMASARTEDLPYRAAKKRPHVDLQTTPAATSTVGSDPPAKSLLPAFDKAIAAAQKHAQSLPEDVHQVWALRRAKAAVLKSIQH